jgi:mitogen-activated protein kinase organizer 1
MLRLLSGLDLDTGSVNAVRFTSDGNYCMAACENKAALLINPHKDDPSNLGSAFLVKSYKGAHGYGILDVAISADNAKFATVGGDRAAFYWDVATGRVIRRIQGHAHRINAASMNEDSTILLTGSYDKTVSAWDLKSNNRDPIQTLTDATDSVTAVLATPSCIITGSVDGYLRTYDMRAGQLRTDNLGEPITCVRLSGDGKCALCTCLGGVIRLVHLTTGQVLQEYSGGHMHKAFKLEACIAGDDNHVIACSEDECASFVHYNLVSGQVVKKTPTISSPAMPGAPYGFEHNEKSIRSTHSSSNGTGSGAMLIAASEAAVRAKMSTSLSSVSHHPSKPILLTGSYDGFIKIWDLAADR